MQLRTEAPSGRVFVMMNHSVRAKFEGRGMPTGLGSGEASYSWNVYDFMNRRHTAHERLPGSPRRDP